MNKGKGRAQPLDLETVSIDSANLASATTDGQTTPSQQREKIVKDETVSLDTETSTVKMDNEQVAPKPRAFSKGFAVFLLFSFAWLLYLLSSTVAQVWLSNWWLGLPLAVISAMFVITVLLMIKRELNAIQRVDENDQLRHMIQQAINNESMVETHQLLRPRLRVYKKTYPAEYAAFENAHAERNSPEEYLSLFENILLSKLDKDADEAIKKAAISIAALVAISPHPALDAVLVFFRAQMLIKKISQIYGLRPTGLSSLYLLKHSIVSAIVSASVDELGTIMLADLHAGLAAKISKLVAEGIVSSTRIYRLGHVSKNMIRPLPSQKTKRSHFKENLAT